MSPMTDKMVETLAKLAARGFLMAGHGDNGKGSLERIAASTLRALAARGYAELSLSPDGGMMAKVTYNGKQAAKPAPIDPRAHGPLQLDGLAVGNAKLSLTVAPGRKTNDGFQRNVKADVASLAAADTKILVTLCPEAEMKTIGVDFPALRTELVDREIAHINLPIIDQGAPHISPRVVALHVRGIHRALAEGDNVVVHCRGGLGRSGLVAACVLVWDGYTHKTAIAKVRAIRPGAVETEEQESYIEMFAMALVSLKAELEA